MNIKYLCNRWQGLLEQVVNLVGHGYVYYHVTVFPSEKADTKKLDNLDRKMITKYRLDTTKNKDAFYQRKKKGLANFRYLRWENILIVLHTEGMILTNEQRYDNLFSAKQFERFVVHDMDKFLDVRKTPITIAVGEEVAFNIQLLPKKEVGEKASVKFTREFMRNKQAELAEFIEKRHTARVVDCFNRLNGIPCWRGIIHQKRTLKQFVQKQCKHNGIKLDMNRLFVASSRKKEDNIFIK